MSSLPLKDAVTRKNTKEYVTEEVVVKEQHPKRRVIIESIIVFVITYIIVWGVLYFGAPQYIKCESSSSSGSDMWKPILGVGLVALVVALIYAGLRHSQMPRAYNVTTSSVN